MTKWVLVVSDEMNGMNRKIDVPMRVLDGGWTDLNEAMTWAIDNPDQVFLDGRGTLAPVPVTVMDGRNTCGCKTHSSGVKVLCKEHTDEARSRG